MTQPDKIPVRDFKLHTIAEHERKISDLPQTQDGGAGWPADIPQAPSPIRQVVDNCRKAEADEVEAALHGGIDFKKNIYQDQEDAALAEYQQKQSKSAGAIVDQMDSDFSSRLERLAKGLQDRKDRKVVRMQLTERRHKERLGEIDQRIKDIQDQRDREIHDLQDRRLEAVEEYNADIESIENEFDTEIADYDLAIRKCNAFLSVDDETPKRKGKKE